MFLSHMKRRSSSLEANALWLWRCRSSSSGGDLEVRVRDLEAKNAELEKKLASDGTRRDEQVGTLA